MFIADWDGLWSPNEKGAIFVKDDPGAAQSSARLEVEQILNDGVMSRSIPTNTPLAFPRWIALGGLPYKAKTGQRRPFVGAMDEVAIYNRALGAEEIRRHYRMIAGP